MIYGNGAFVLGMYFNLFFQIHDPNFTKLTEKTQPTALGRLPENLALPGLIKFIKIELIWKKHTHEDR